MKKDFLEFELAESVGDFANYKLPDPGLLDYYKRLKNREILINCNIDDTIIEFTQEIIQWNREDKDLPIEERKPIKIFINSNGGSLNAIMELITVCNLSKTPVKAIGLGKCYSSGGLLLIGCPDRYILSTTEVLIHDGYAGSEGETGKMIDDLERTKKNEEFVKDFVVGHTKITPDEYDKNYRRNWWLDSDDIIKYGIADHIVENIEDLF